MNFPSSRLLRSSPLVPSRALFRLPSSFFFPPPSCFRFHAYQHKPLGRSTPLHRSSKFFLFIEGRRLAGPSNLETTIFSSPPFSSSSFFLLLLLQNRTDGRAFPPRLSASCAPGSRAPSSIDETATRYVEISSSSSSPLSRRSRAGGDANRFLVAPVAPCRSNANRSTLLRFPFRKNRHSIVYLHLRLLLERDRSPRINNGPPPFPALLSRTMERNYDSLRLGVIFLPPIVRHPEVSNTDHGNFHGIMADFAPVSFFSFFFFLIVTYGIIGSISFLPFFFLREFSNEMRVPKFSRLK